MSKSFRIGIIVGGVVLAILLILPVVWGGFSGWRGGGWGMMGPGGGMMGPGMMGGFGWGWGMGIGMVLFWGLVIWAIVALVRGPSHHDDSAACWGHPEHSDSALEVLKRRYASGEIGKEEYEQKKRDMV